MLPKPGMSAAPSHPQPRRSISVLVSQGLSVFHSIPASHPSQGPLRSTPFSTMDARRAVKSLDLIMSSAFPISWMAALGPKANGPIPYLT